ncbi:MAG: YfhO family protein [Blastocatellia bacterium]
MPPSAIRHPPSAIRNLGVALFILLFFGLFFWRGIFGGKFFLISDPLVYSYPLRQVAWDMIREGQAPLWTPVLFSGYPLFSMSQLAIAYPLTWGYLFLPGYVAEQAYILAPYLFAPWFMYLYARELGRSRMAALLAGLSFSYGGMMASWLGNGLMPNAVMWTPLVLLGAYRARTRPLIPCLALVALAYAMSILSGLGQGFVFAGLLALAHGLFLSMFDCGISDCPWTAARHYKPVAATMGGMAMAMGLTAFQILETWQAKQLSIRQQLSWDLYSQLSYPMAMIWRAMLAPIHHFIETTAWVNPLALLAALLAVIAALRRPRQHPHTWFWLFILLLATALMTGPETPLHGLVYRMPILNGFRGPSRHSFEWTLALGMLAATGWDCTSKALARRASYGRAAMVMSAAGWLACLITGWQWLRAIPRPDVTGYWEAETAWIIWKALFCLLLFTALWLCMRTAASRARLALTLALLFTGCFTEAWIISLRWWIWEGNTAQRMTAISAPGQLLRQSPPEQNRVYIRTPLFTDTFRPPRIDTPNLSGLAGLHNVTGYEPLIPARYSQALGGVWLDGITRLDKAPADLSLFDPQSYVADLLNTRFVLGFAGMGAAPLEKEGIGYAAENLAPPRPGESLRLAGLGARGDTLLVVSALANSGAVIDDEPVARIDVRMRDGRTISRVLRAGRDTAEWAHERADVRPHIRHRLALVFEKTPGDAQNSFSALRYLARIPLETSGDIADIEIRQTTHGVGVQVYKATIHDAQTGQSTPLSSDTFLAPLLDTTRWEMVYHAEGVVALRNNRALPRAWLTTTAEAVTPADALARIQGRGAPFDPRQTALLETNGAALPALPGGAMPADSQAKLTHYEPNQLTIETTAGHSTMLVVSEMNYPGWQAWLDGAPAPMYTANYLLRGVFVPAGQHRVEMRYTAPALKHGLLISGVTLLLLIALWLSSRGWWLVAGGR